MFAVVPTPATPSTRPSRVHLLRELLREELVNGDPGARLPSEHELCARHGESRNVVRDALGLLREEGLIERRQGIGTYAVVARPEHSGTRMYFVAEDLGSSNARFETLGVEQIPAPARVASRLLIDAGAPVVSIQRLTWLDDRPFSLQTSLLPLPLASWLLEHPPDCEWYQGLEEAGMVPAGAEQVLEATVADTHVAALLHIDVAAPLLLFERVLLLADGRPIEFGMVRCRGDRVAVRIPAQARGAGEGASR